MTDEQLTRSQEEDGGSDQTTDQGDDEERDEDAFPIAWF